MHAQGADEVALHHPEGLGEEEGVGRLARAHVHDLPPELSGHGGVEFGSAHRVLGARRHVPAGAGLGVPQAPEVPAGEDHGRVEADDGEVARHVEDALLDGLPRLGLEEVDLRRVAPGQARAVVAVVDVARLARGPVDAAEDHSGVAARVVMVLEPDLHAAVAGEVAPGEVVAREGAALVPHEELGPLTHPGRVDADVVRHHVRGEADAAPAALLAQPLQRGPAAELGRDLVVEEGVGRGRGLGVAAAALDLGARGAPLPDADEPERVEAPRGQRVELLVGDGVQRPDVAPVGDGELVEPDQAALRHHHDVGHPVAVRREALVLALHARVDVGARGPRAREEGLLLLADEVEAAEEAEQAVAEEEPPARLDVLELARQGIGRGGGGAAQHRDEVLPLGPEARQAREAPLRGSQGGRVVSRRGAARGREDGLVEKEAEGREGGILVGEPEEEELLEGLLPADPGPGGVPGALEPGRRVLLAAIHLEGREALHEGGEEPLEPSPADLARDVLEEEPEAVGRDALAVEAGHVVEDLVDEGHGVEAARLDRALGKEGRVDGFVDAAREGPRGSEVRQYHVAAAAVQASFDAEGVAGPAGDMEFHDAVAGPRLEGAVALEGGEPHHQHRGTIAHRHLQGRLSACAKRAAASFDTTPWSAPMKEVGRGGFGSFAPPACEAS